MRARVICRSCLCVLLFGVAPLAMASDWPRFRGPNGSGVSPDSEPTATTWTDTENVKWSVDLPGPGSSCPNVVGDKVFVTCWSGYGLSRDEPGDQSQLKRHLMCFDRQTGETLWDRVVDPYLPEDEYGGMFAEHGYTSHTPVSDGAMVFAFFGKTGVVAFDMDGNEKWRQSVGTESDPRNWGTASSPILYKDLVIVPAAVENHALVAFNKKTGEEVWKQEAQGFEGTWGSPILAEAGGGKQNVVWAVPGELWAFDPDNKGKLAWYVTGMGGDACSTSAVTADGIVYLVGGRDGRTVAVKADGSGDVTDTKIQWTENMQGGIGTPVLHDGKLYSISREVVTCIDATTGEVLFKKRLEAPVAEEPADAPAAEGENPGGGRRGGRGGFMNQSYASPVIADGKLYFMTRAGLCYVFKLGDEFEQVAANKFGSDEADFSASPAISEGEIFIRSSKKLYCVAEK